MISVVIPTHNRGDRIKDAIESVLNQTERDLEVLVVDDGSTDNTREIVASIPDPRVKYARQEKAGACQARNRGVALSKGELIAFHDSDDLWRPEKLSLQLQCLEQTGADIVVSVIAERREDGTVVLLPFHLKQGFLTESDALFGIGTQTVMGRRRAFEDFPFDPEMPRFQEMEMLYRARKQYSIYFLDAVVADYRPGNDSISSDVKKLFLACDLLDRKHPELLRGGSQAAYMLALRLIAEAEQACRTSTADCMECLKRAEALGNTRRIKQLLFLGRCGLYPLYLRVRNGLWRAKSGNTALWRAVAWPVRRLRKLRDTFREIREAEPIRLYARKKQAFGASLARRMAVYKTVDILTHYHTALFHGLTRRFLDRLTADITSPVQTERSMPADQMEPIPVWALWWDGLENAPECVKVCVASQRKYFTAPEYAYRLLTKDNYAQYATLDPAVMKRFQEDALSLTHLSDVLRCSLLAENGGLWMDATLYMTGPLNRQDLSGELFTNRKTINPENLRRIVAGGRWSVYMLQTAPGNPLMCFLREAFARYWENYREAIDYYLFDYLIDTAWRRFPEVRRMMEKVPINNEHIFDLYAIRNEVYDPRRVQPILNENCVHKFSYKDSYDTVSRNGRMTIWRWMREETKIQ